MQVLWRNSFFCKFQASLIKRLIIIYKIIWKLYFYIILIPWSNFKRNKCFELFSYAKFWKEEFEAGNNKWRHIGRSYRLERRGEHEIVSWLYAAIACIRCYSSWYWKNLYNFVSFIHVKITLTWLWYFIVLMWWSCISSLDERRIQLYTVDNLCICIV